MVNENGLPRMSIVPSIQTFSPQSSGQAFLYTHSAKTSIHSTTASFVTHFIMDRKYEYSGHRRQQQKTANPSVVTAHVAAVVFWTWESISALRASSSSLVLYILSFVA